MDGEYATDALERDFFIDNDEDINTIQLESKFEFKAISRETDKAWLLVMSGGAEKWFPKSVCRIEDDLIFLPAWLEVKMMEEAIRQLQIKNSQSQK